MSIIILYGTVVRYISLWVYFKSKWLAIAISGFNLVFSSVASMIYLEWKSPSSSDWFGGNMWWRKK